MLGSCSPLEQEKVFVVSYPKAGRTWLRLMIAFCVNDATIETAVEATENKRLRDDFPYLIFEHGNHVEPKSFHEFFEIIAEERVVLLFRDPRDVVVSSYFQESLRNERYTSGSLDDFVQDPNFGINSIVHYYNEAIRCISDPFIVHYELMHSAPESTLRALFSKLGVVVPDNSIYAAVARCKFEILQREAKSSKNFRLAPTDLSNPESQKFRRGRIGGYVEYLNPVMLDYSAKALELLDARYTLRNN